MNSETDSAAEASPSTATRNAKRIVARNTVFGIFAQIVLKVANILFQVYVVRTLGGAEFGQYNIVLAWAGLFSVLGDLGVSQYLQREIARDPSRTQELFWDATAVRLILAVLCSAVTVGSAIIFAYDFSTEMFVGLFVFTLGYFVQTLIVPMNVVLSGNERIDLTSVFAVIQQVNFMILATLVLVLNLDFMWLLIVGTLNLPITLVIHYWAVRRNNLGPPRFRFNPHMWWPLIRLGLPFGLQQLSLSFAFRVDTVLLNQFGVSNLEVGWYTIAYTNLTLTFLSLASSFNMAVLPTLAREHAQDVAIARTWYFRSIKLLLFLGLPIAVGGMVLSWNIMEFLYPEELPAAIPLMILIWDIPIVMYHSYCGITSTSIRREGAGARIYFAVGVTNITLNLILIPRLGIIGSSFATVITDSVAALLFYVLFSKEFGAGLGFNRLARIGLAAIIMGIVVYLLHDLHVLLLIPIGVVVYLAAVFASGAFTVEERQQFLGLYQKAVNRLQGIRAAT